jgi:putative FmdB family regulatory protein
MKYDFKCSKCGNIHEITASIKDGPIAPKCCGILTQRIFQPTNFAIKGYNTANNYDKSNPGWQEKIVTGK